ncbi:hypothetical protein jhhlp_008792 [Lomentospora prolificans]|uniref:Uncharacterized protein n=1 Tax=Lomentospora prolificans TaxID=41688 RepID=A0A2N3MZ06_9PEZI|nr:hypothetical protein jhhlp_008792 [Lomentospora prolificans]
MCLYTAAVFIRENRMTRKQGSLKVIASEDAHQARFIDPYDIGGFATRLICEKDFIRHNKAKYCCTGIINAGILWLSRPDDLSVTPPRIASCASLRSILSVMGSASSTENASADGAGKKSLYKRYRDSKASKSDTISDEDMLKYTGKTRDEMNNWAKTAPGVAGNQAAGKLTMGPTSGLSGTAATEGLGGWGWDSNSAPKYPPKQDQGGKEASK